MNSHHKTPPTPRDSGPSKNLPLLKIPPGLRANTFGFYAIKGHSTIDFKEKSRKEDIIEFLKLIRTLNPYGRIMIILDNFRSHHARLTTQTAEKLHIDLVFIPPYSPHLNPIEY